MNVQYNATRNYSSWLNEKGLAFPSVQVTNEMKSNAICVEGEATWASMTSCRLISEILFNLVDVMTALFVVYKTPGDLDWIPAANIERNHTMPELQHGYQLHAPSTHRKEGWVSTVPHRQRLSELTRSLARHTHRRTAETAGTQIKQLP